MINKLVKEIENMWWWNHVTFQKENAKNKSYVSHSHAMHTLFSPFLLSHFSSHILSIGHTNFSLFQLTDSQNMAIVLYYYYNHHYYYIIT
jgi:hypothetical protein